MIIFPFAFDVLLGIGVLASVGFSPDLLTPSSHSTLTQYMYITFYLIRLLGY